MLSLYVIRLSFKYQFLDFFLTQLKLALRISLLLKRSLPIFSLTKSISTSQAKMVKEYHVKGYEEFTKLAESLESTGENVHILFSGGKDETGESKLSYINVNWSVIINICIEFHRQQLVPILR